MGMERNHTYMSRQNLADISHYSKLSLEKLERGAGELPQWVNHLLSVSRAHMQDVGHFLREQAKEGKRFGGMHSNTEFISGGLASGMNPRHFDPSQLRVGTEVEMEHTNDPRVAREIASDHLAEHPHGYYEALAKMEGELESRAPWYGIAGLQSPRHRRFSGHEPGHAKKGPPAYMARKNLREIGGYADASQDLVESGAGIFPAWVEHKLSVVAQNMDTVGHYLENEDMEGRKYGSRESIPFPGDMGDVAYNYGIADGMGGQHRPDRWDVSQINVYEQGWREGNQQKNKTDSQPRRAHHYGMADALEGNDFSDRWAKTPYLEIYRAAQEEINGRRYGARGGASGGGRGGVARGGPRGPGPSGGGGRPGQPARPGVPGMGGRGRHFRRHRHRQPSYIYPAWGYPDHPWWGHLGYYPAPLYVEEEYPIPVVRHVYAHRVKRQLLPEIPDSFGVIGMTGSGFDNVPDALVISYRIGTGAWRSDKAVILTRDDGNMEIAIPVSDKVLSGFALSDIGYYMNETFVSFGASFFSTVPRPWNPFVRRRRFGAACISSINRDVPSIRGERRLYASTEPPEAEYAEQFAAPPPLRPLQASKMMQMFPPNRMLEDNRMGKWHRMEGEPTGRQFGTPPPGWAGNGGVAQVSLAVARGGEREGPRAVQTYGSLGYASMGDGSMDMAARSGGRTFAQTEQRGRDLSRSHKKRRRLLREGRW